MHIVKKNKDGKRKKVVKKLKKTMENEQSDFLSDRAGAKQLNVSVNTFRKLAQNAGAVYFFGKTRRTNMPELRQKLKYYKP